MAYSVTDNMGFNEKTSMSDSNCKIDKIQVAH